MKKIRTIAWAIALGTLQTACHNNKVTFDASGSFEADETVISAEASGKIMQLGIEEGQLLKAGQTIGYIDSLQLYLKKKQIEAQIEALLRKKPNVALQLSALQEQLRTAETERTRITNLVKGNAATSKQLDDINVQIELLKRQIEAQRSTLSIAVDGLEKDIVPLQVQIEQLNDQLSKCRLVNPIDGTVLTQYAKVHEMTAAGKPIYKIADLPSLILRVYITGDQLPQIKLNQQVKVITDDSKDGSNETVGTIIWISDKAEFTPKTVQAKDERANKVYAVKVKVKNNGRYKIGMYGEIQFQ